jgi:serine/threonine protein kinase
VVFDEDKFPHLPPTLVVAWLLDLADALSYLHSKQVKHSDIKPDNIYVFQMFQIKLGGFETAKFFTNYGDISGSTIGGTLGFMAPEVLDGEGSSVALDMFSFAITALVIMNRQLPQRQRKSTQRLLQSIKSAVSTLELSNLSDELTSLLERCIQLDPSERPTAEEACRGLRKILEANGSDPRVEGNAMYESIVGMNRRADENYHELVK